MNILKVLQVGVQIGYPGAILVHPMRRQNFAGKSQFLQDLRLCHIGIPFFLAFLGTDLCLCFAVLILLIIWGRQRETIVVIQNFDILPLITKSVRNVKTDCRETAFQNYDLSFPPQRKTEEANKSNLSFARQNQMRFLSVNTHSKDL